MSMSLGKCFFMIEKDDYRKIINRKNRGKSFSVVVVAEGAKPIGGNISVANVRDNGAGVDNTKLGGAGERVARELE